MQANHTRHRRNIFSSISNALAISFVQKSARRGLFLRNILSALFLIQFVFCSFSLTAATYYIAPNGSDGAIGDLTHPFATLNKAWKVVIAGDIVYMRGGTYTFTSQQVLTGKNGIANNYIKVWAYTGEIPVITFSSAVSGIALTGNYINFKGIQINGLTTLSAWTNVGNGIYSTPVTCQAQEYAPAGSTNMVTVNGVNTALGRYPNVNAANGGYLTFSSHSGTTSITDPTLPATPNYTGGELVVRRNHWTIDRSLITNHSSSVITYSAFPNAKPWDIQEPRDGYGYFIQNNINTLDQVGEWCYNGTTMYMYFGSNNPTSYVVKASTVNDLFSITNSSYVTFEGMTLQGGNSTSFKSSFSNYITVNNCNINYSGKYGIHISISSNNVQVLNCSIRNSNSGGIRLDEANNNLISGNTVTNTGILAGMGAQIRLLGICEGISTASANYCIAEYNRVINCGYNGIKLDGKGTITRNNFIDTFCSVRDDGGGVYLYGGDASVKREIKNNIILNGIGALAGTIESNNTYGFVGSPSGIYMDEKTVNVEISGNTVYNCNYDGVYLHDVTDMNVHHNTFYKNRDAQINMVHDNNVIPDFPLRNIIIDNNICVTLTHEVFGPPWTTNITQKALVYGTTTNDIALFGVSNNNYFISPLDNDPKFYTWYQLNSGYGTTRTFAGWKTYSGQDANSHLSPVTVPDVSYIRFEYNDTTVNKVIALGGTYVDAKGIQYVGSITLLPYTSAILMRTSSTNQVPVIQNQGFNLNENSPNSTIVGTVVATDPDAGQTLTYSILSGNTNGAFAINASTGKLTVATSSVLNYEAVTSFALIIKVQDNGAASLSNQATITVTLLNVNEPPVLNSQTFSVVQLATNGTQVGTVQATDPDAGQTRSFSIVSGNTSSAFSINASTGIITVATSSALNILVNPVFNLIIRVTDNGTASLYTDGTITINVIQSANQPPVISNQTFSVSTSATNGTLVGNVVASDPDAGQTLTYSVLSGNTNGAFAINASSGAITVANASALISGAAGTAYSLFQSVTPSASSINYIGTGTAPLEVGMKFYSNVDGIVSGFRFYKGAGAQGIHIGNLWNIAGVNLASATFTGETASGWQTVTLATPVAITANTIYVVSYFSAHGDYVKTVPFFTADVVNGPLTGLGWTTTQPNGVYRYNATSAFPNNNAYVTNTNFWADVIFSVTPAAPTSFSLVVKVQDNGTGNLSSQANITVNLINEAVNNSPVISNQAFALNENTPNTTTFGNVVATDPDAGQSLTYSILSGNTNGAFSINTATGVLTVSNSASLNYEITPSFSLVVKVQDNGTVNLSSQATITVSLININEFPVISNQVFSVNENSPNSTVVGNVVASDPDAGQTLTYSIISGNTNNAFTINTSSGSLAVATSAALNFEVTPSFSLVMRVQDNGTGSLVSQATVSVTLLNVNEPPVANNQAFSIAHLAVNGTQVGTVIATDPDAGQTLSYSITAGNTSNAFSINSSSGIISVANSAAINYLTNPVFNLNVRVTDNGTGNLYDDATITINVLSINRTPVINNQSFSLNENSLNGTAFATVLASDPDAGQTLTFSILSGNTNNAFALSAAGVITVANSAVLNYEVTPSFSLLVKVQDNGVGNLSSQATITVTLLNINEFPLFSNQGFSIIENSPSGTMVGSVVASDPDAGQTLTYSIISGNTNNAFAINASSGVLTVITSSATNYEVTPTFALIMRVQDNGPGNLICQAAVTITLINMNEVPVINYQAFDLNANSMNGTTAGTVVASDPDAGQTLTYSILSGNTNNAFAINTSNGALTVANSDALNNGYGVTYSVFKNITPSAAAINYIGNGTAPLEVGMKFRSNIDGYVYGFRFYKGVGSQGTHIGNLWSISGVNLATATFTGETSSGWQTVTLSSPVAITANTIYVVSYFSQHGDYVKNVPYFTADIVNGPLTGLGWTTAQPNGVYRYSTTSAFPNNNAYITNTNFWADVIFSSTPPPDYFDLLVKVQDNGTGSLSNEATITINLQRVLKSMTAEEFANINTINKLKIYPNPLPNKILNVELETAISEQFDLTIYDMSGKFLMNKQYEPTNNISLDLSTYPPGLYAVRIHSLNFNTTDKFILQ